MEVEPVGGEAVLRVRDTGIGIAPELLPRIFDLFVQSERGLDRRDGGLGVGLSIVRRLVEAHGGRVEARSAGTEPRRRDHRPIAARGRAGRAERSAPPGRPAPPAGASWSSTTTWTRAKRWSRCSSSPVTTCTRPRTAPAVSSRRRASAPMPCSSTSACRASTASSSPAGCAPGARRLRLIALTGYGHPDYRRRGAEAGFDAYLVKPVAIDCRAARDPGPRPPFRFARVQLITRRDQPSPHRSASRRATPDSGWMRTSTVAALLRLSSVPADEGGDWLEDVLRIDSEALEVARVSYWSLHADPPGSSASSATSLPPACSSGAPSSMNEPARSTSDSSTSSSSSTPPTRAPTRAPATSGRTSSRRTSAPFSTRPSSCRTDRRGSSATSTSAGAAPGAPRIRSSRSPSARPSSPGSKRTPATSRKRRSGGRPSSRRWRPRWRRRSPSRRSPRSRCAARCPSWARWRPWSRSRGARSGTVRWRTSPPRESASSPTGCAGTRPASRACT